MDYRCKRQNGNCVYLNIIMSKFVDKIIFEAINKENEFDENDPFLGIPKEKLIIAKKKFQDALKKKMLYHVTLAEHINSIKKNGLNSWANYFSVFPSDDNENRWNAHADSYEIEVDPKVNIDIFYPDPESIHVPGKFGGANYASKYMRQEVMMEPIVLYYFWAKQNNIHWIFSFDRIPPKYFKNIKKFNKIGIEDVENNTSNFSRSENIKRNKEEWVRKFDTVMNNLKNEKNENRHKLLTKQIVYIQGKLKSFYDFLKIKPEYDLNNFPKELKNIFDNGYKDSKQYIDFVTKNYTKE